MIEITTASTGQRIDNYLFRTCKGVPKSHIYQILRSGQVRVNKKRIEAAYRLMVGDQVRVPPLRMKAPSSEVGARAPAATFPILYEDDCLLAIDKPAGVAVHGGSGMSFGVIEQLREQYRRTSSPPKCLELVHRLDRDTSGILLLAKKRSTLRGLHEQLRAGAIGKRYLVCVHGKWSDQQRVVKVPLGKYLTPSGERRVRVQPDGLPAHTVFRLIKCFANWALLEAELKTGRTHQIRVHLAHLGMPIVGDDKYGDFALNRELARAHVQPGIKRMFLHAFRLHFTHPATNEPVKLEAALPDDCQRFLSQLDELSA